MNITKRYRPEEYRDSHPAKESKTGDLELKRWGSEVDGIRFSYYNEGNLYVELLKKELLGEIHDLYIKPTIELQPKFEHQGAMVRSVTFAGDFMYTDSITGQTCLYARSRTTNPSGNIWRLKEKLFKYNNPTVSYFTY